MDFQFDKRIYWRNREKNRVSEGSPSEEIFEDEQELLKKLYETKSGLLESRWIVQNKQSISQPSFISTNVMDGEVSVEFE